MNCGSIAWTGERYNWSLSAQRFNETLVLVLCFFTCNWSKPVKCMCLLRVEICVRRWSSWRCQGSVWNLHICTMMEFCPRNFQVRTKWKPVYHWSLVFLWAECAGRSSWKLRASWKSLPTKWTCLVTFAHNRQSGNSHCDRQLGWDSSHLRGTKLIGSHRGNEKVHQRRAVSELEFPSPNFLQKFACVLSGLCSFPCLCRMETLQFGEAF